MQIIVSSLYNNVDYTKLAIKNKARRNILIYPLKSVDLAMDYYLKKEYKKSLKQVCLLLLKNCKVMDDSTEVIVVFHDKKLEAIAELITYGNGKLVGSNIFKQAFK